MPWTEITADTSWQELEVAQEIAVAMNLRIDALNVMGHSFESYRVTPTQNTAVYSFILNAQYFVLGAYQYFADKNASIPGDAPLLESFWYIGDFMSASGLTESGLFRRIAEGGTQPAAWQTYNAAGWSYGVMQSKDLAGPWLFIDIQTALSAMTRTLDWVMSLYSDNVDVVGHRGYDTIYQEGSGYASLPSQISLTTTGQVDNSIIELRKVVQRGDGVLESDYNYHRETSIWWSIAQNEYTLSNMPTVAKTVYLVGLPKLRDANGVSEVSFGNALVDATPNVYDSVISSTAQSITIKDFEIPEYWSTYDAYVSWPSDQVGETVLNRETAIFHAIDYENYAVIIVDYEFDP